VKSLKFGQNGSLVKPELIFYCVMTITWHNVGLQREPLKTLIVGKRVKRSATFQKTTYSSQSKSQNKNRPQRSFVR
jgi:hypothetical protein